MEQETKQGSPIIPYVAPFALFMVLTTIESISALKPYYPFLYTFKVIAVTGTWLWFRHEYPAYSNKGMLWGVGYGIVGVVVWVGLVLIPLQEQLPDFLRSWIGGNRAAYNPYKASIVPAFVYAFLAVRFLGLVIMVPLMEEVFWRGFLVRYLMEDDFRSVPLGKFTMQNAVIVTLIFALLHPEVLSALVWGAGMFWLFRKTESLWACIWAHAVTNLLLGIYVIVTGAWYLW